ncbi:hypothetical protein ABFS83_02G096800 [Erythranthe nasuta]
MRARLEKMKKNAEHENAENEEFDNEFLHPHFPAADGSGSDISVAIVNTWGNNTCKQWEPQGIKKRNLLKALLLFAAIEKFSNGFSVFHFVTFIPFYCWYIFFLFHLEITLWKFG